MSSLGIGSGPYVFSITGSDSTITIQKSIVVPEPSTLAIFALGMIGLASRRFKNKY